MKIYSFRSDHIKHVSISRSFSIPVLRHLNSAFLARIVSNVMRFWLAYRHVAMVHVQSFGLRQAVVLQCDGDRL